jgi:hypothetical protein
LPSLRPAAAGRRALTARLGALLLLSLAVLSAGCGGDQESSADPPPEAPELTIPETDQAPPPPTDTTPTTETTPPPTDGGTPTPPPAETPTDTPENDTPPPQDSPAERFERFCNDNPGACG